MGILFSQSTESEGSEASQEPVLTQDALSKDDRESGGHVSGSNSGGTLGGASAFHSAQHVTITESSVNVAGRDNITNHNVVNNFYAHPNQDTLLDVLEWLATINFRDIHMENGQKRTKGTGMWFIDSELFQAWKYSNGGILWGTGMPGAGKTILASHVIDHLEDYAKSRDIRIAVAYAYCRYTERIAVRDILAALVRQLLERHPEILPVILPIYTKHRREKTRPSQDELLGLLKEISKVFDINFYELDGLDEALDDTKFDLVTALESLGGHFFITSRPLDSLKSAVPGAQFFEVVAHDEDIELLIADKIDRDSRFRKLLEKHGRKQVIISKILDKSGGMFLHASLQVDALRRCMSIRDLEKKLDEFPAKMEDMYGHTMARIKSQSEEEADLAQRALIWLLYSEAPLRLDDLLNALAVCPETYTFEPDRLVEESSLLSVCCGLVTVEITQSHPRLVLDGVALEDHFDGSLATDSEFPDSPKIVRLIHYTAKDALPPLLADSYPEPYRLLALTCLQRLRSFNISSIPFEARWTILYNTLNSDSFLQHAHKNWAIYVRYSHALPDVLDMAYEFIHEWDPYPYNFGFEGVDHLSPLHVGVLYNLPAHLLDRLMGQHDDPTVARETFDINLTTSQQRTPLRLATAAGHTTVVRWLLEFSRVRANVVESDSKTALTRAFKCGNPEIIDCLLNYPDIKVNVVDGLGQTAIVLALHTKNLKALRRMLAIPQTDPNLVDGNGRTGLLVASTFGLTEFVECLLEFPGIDVNAVDRNGRTALVCASAWGHVGIVKHILGHPDTQVDRVDRSGWTALKHARSIGNSEIVGWLVPLSSIEDDDHADRPDDGGFLDDVPNIQVERGDDVQH